jgi:hypothetical protein
MPLAHYAPGCCEEAMTAEHDRLIRDGAAWKMWGPYVSDRAWGTVREDYSADGSAWTYFPHDHARSRVYRWNEDGLAAICDDQQRLCFGVALWNGRDPILKERLFGLTGPEGNHGEDVKEYYFHLDSTPTHSYMKLLYKYPQAPFPYTQLVEQNARRGREQGEFELLDCGVFDQDRYFDVFVEYAKSSPHDILVRITVENRGPEPASLHVLPTVWFRNTWIWGSHDDTGRPELRAADLASAVPDTLSIVCQHPTLGRYMLDCATAPATPELLFTENETNAARLYGAANPTPYVKDGINDYVVGGDAGAVNPAHRGTKAAVHYQLTVDPGQAAVLRLRLHQQSEGAGPRADRPWHGFEACCAQRIAEADTYYAAIQPATLSDDMRRVSRQALAGMLWTKQFYHFDVYRWLKGDPAQPPPPGERWHIRNSTWTHLNTADIISMPDAWEYPWFASWDLAFHCITLALVDSDFAKRQLVLMGREWLQHANGQTPAYEWAFGDANPPVLAWAAWRVYKIEQKQRGAGDRTFLERMFHKLLINFTWWVNRKDTEGKNVFEGGFLGLDNIGVFDRSAPLPGGGHIEQSDSTSWMGMYCLNMLTISLELAQLEPIYQDIATKFFEHFLLIADAMNNIAGSGIQLWDEQDEFFYDVLHQPDGHSFRLKVRSMVGIIPLFAVTTIEPALLEKLPEFAERLVWFLEHRPDLAALVSRWQEPGQGARRLLALCRGHRMKCVLRRALDEGEFLSPFGVRSLSRFHAEHPYELELAGASHTVSYQPGESQSGLFGGNSNWRGPVWFPVNYLLIEALQQFHHYYGDDFLVECPTGSGRFLTLKAIADELSNRLIALFLRDPHGRRPMLGDDARLQSDPHWRDYLPFPEYFHGETGLGLGASHQTGWTGLVAKLIQQQGEHGTIEG